MTPPRSSASRSPSRTLLAESGLHAIPDLMPVVTSRAERAGRALASAAPLPEITSFEASAAAALPRGRKLLDADPGTYGGADGEMGESFGDDSDFTVDATVRERRPPTARPLDAPRERDARPLDDPRQRDARPLDEPRLRDARPVDEPRLRDVRPADEPRARDARPVDGPRERPSTFVAPP